MGLAGIDSSLQRGKAPPIGGIKKSDCEAPVIQELWGIRSTSSLPLLPGRSWFGVVAPDRVQFMDPMVLFDI